MAPSPRGESTGSFFVSLPSAKWSVTRRWRLLQRESLTRAPTAGREGSRWGSAWEMHGRTKRSTQRAGSNNTTAVKTPEIHQKKFFFFPAEVVRCPAPPRASACPFSHACSEIRVIGAPAQAQALQLSSAPAPSAAQPQPGTGPCFPPCCCREGWGWLWHLGFGSMPLHKIQAADGFRSSALVKY